MHDPDAQVPQEPQDVQGTRSRDRKVSFPAVLGVLGFVLGAIAFGILGPRMEQRVSMVPGHPLEDLVGLVIQDHYIAWGRAMGRARPEPINEEEALGILQKRMGPSVALPQLKAQGWELFDAEEAWASGLDSPGAIRLTYTGAREGAGRKLLMVHLVQEPWGWIHFDQLGRQVPLAPGSRIDEMVGLAEGSKLGVSIICLPSHAAIVTALDPRDAIEAADHILGMPGRNDDLEESDAE